MNRSAFIFLLLVSFTATGASADDIEFIRESESMTSLVDAVTDHRPRTIEGDVHVTSYADTVALLVDLVPPDGKIEHVFQFQSSRSIRVAHRTLRDSTITWYGNRVTVRSDDGYIDLASYYHEDRPRWAPVGDIDVLFVVDGAGIAVFDSIQLADRSLQRTKEWAEGVLLPAAATCGTGGGASDCDAGGAGSSGCETSGCGGAPSGCGTSCNAGYHSCCGCVSPPCDALFGCYFVDIQAKCKCCAN